MKEAIIFDDISQRHLQNEKDDIKRHSCPYAKKILPLLRGR
jgi:hypothetical protein